MFSENAASPGQVAQQEWAFANGGLFRGETARFHCAQQHKRPRATVDRGQALPVPKRRPPAPKQIRVLSGQRVKLPRVRISFGVSLANDPERRFCVHRCFGQLENPLAFSDSRGANEPIPALRGSGLKKCLLDPVGHYRYFLFWRTKQILHQMRFPGSHRNDGVGQPIRSPIERGHELGGGETLDQTTDRSLKAQLVRRTGTGAGQKFAHHDFDPFLVRQLDMCGGRAAKIMEYLTGLFVVPPAKRFNFHTGGLQESHRALDLDLLASVRQ